MALLSKHQVPNGPVNHPLHKVLEDPRVVQNRVVFETDHPWAPFPIRMARPGPRFSDAPFALRYHAPLLGESTFDVLEEAGLSQDEIKTLASKGVIQKPRAANLTAPSC